jgi:hypothetical protein
MVPVTPLALAFCFYLSTAAHAQLARSMDIDPSIRAAGMGGASGAVFWDATNAWANPALLGYQRGISYEYGSTRRPSGPEGSIEWTTFESQAWRFGAYGLGLSSSGNPIGRVELGYGSYGAQELESWGLGVSAMDLTKNVVSWFGGEVPRWSRFADVSVGMNSKHTGSIDAHDFGILARVTPIDRPTGGDRLPLRLDLAYGYSALSDDATFNGVTLRERPVRSHYINSVAARTTVDWPEPSSPREGVLGWFMTGLAPLASIGLAYDHRLDAGLDQFLGDSPSVTWGGGAELAFLNCVTLRAGATSFRKGDIRGETLGWGLCLPLGRGAGIRYDWASYPDARLPSSLHREGFTAWLNVLEMSKWRGGD